MTVIHRTILTALVIALLALAASGAAAAAPIVKTTSGRLEGVSTKGVREFLGVRYAKAPVGRLRWAPPVPAARARGLVYATKVGPDCPQKSGATGKSAGGKTSEDCLFLNVTAPRGVAPGAHLPVMVWWHGGGYSTGGGGEYGAERLATQGHVIVVTVNMRLGILGYLGLPQLKGGGDFGLEDELLATRWAKRNARAFGGDPGNITVFGESSGAMGACAALTSPAARGLIDKVALSSGSCRLDWPRGGLLPGTPAQTPYASVAADHALSLATAKELKCPTKSTARTLACLRAIPVGKLVPISEIFANHLTYGTPLLPRYPGRALEKGDFLHIPVISGGNAHEESSFVAGAEKALPGHYTDARYPTLLAAAFGAKAAAEVEARYPASSYPSAAAAFAQAITDSSWSCPTLEGDTQLARHTDVFAYEFDDPNSPEVNGVEAPGVPQASAHGTDLPYLFDLDGKDLLTGAPSHRLASRMVAYWTSFAHTGRPTAPGSTPWHRYVPGSGHVLQLRPGMPATIDLAAEHRCAFWRTLGR